MKAFQTSVFAVVMLVLVAQGIRHLYVRFLEPRESVLDKYQETDTRKAIREAESLEALVTQYDVAKKRVDELNNERKAATAEMTKDERENFLIRFHEAHEKEYQSESEWGAAIREWEDRSRQIYELRVFWAFGLAFFVVGAVLLARGRGWLGMALLVPGVIEMIWWSSPSIQFDGCPLEFDRLLNNRLAFTFATFALLIVAWCIREARQRKARPGT